MNMLRKPKYWEPIEEAQTYTIGSTGDYTSLSSASTSDALERKILKSNITLQLQENIELTSNVSFQNLMSAGGNLLIDLSGNLLQIGDVSTLSGITATGPFNLEITDTGTGGELKVTATSINPPHYAITKVYEGILNINSIILNANSKDMTAFLRIFRGAKGRFHESTYNNAGTFGKGWVYAAEISHGGFINTEPSTQLGVAERGSILLDDNDNFLWSE